MSNPESRWGADILQDRPAPFRTDKPAASKSASTRSSTFIVTPSAKPGAAGSRKGSTGAKPANPVRPEKSTALPTDADRKTGDEFGFEGTNKTVATPKPDNAPPDELGLGPHVEKTPYTRG